MYKVEFLGPDFKVKFQGSTYTRVMFLDMLLLSRVVCGMKRKLYYYFITSLILAYKQYTNMLKLLNSIVVHSIR